MRTPEQLVKLVTADFKGTVLDDAKMFFNREDSYFEIKLGTTEMGHSISDANESEAALIVGVADFLQVLVMDETNGAWPEVTNGDRTVVLEPHLNPEGVPVWGWLVGGEDYCAVGDLGRQETL